MYQNAAGNAITTEKVALEHGNALLGFRLTDETYTLPPVRISRKEAFNFALARKLLGHYGATTLHLDMRSAAKPSQLLDEFKMIFGMPEILSKNELGA